MKDKLPNFFIVGAPRAGTTSLYDFLKRTKNIYMPSRKEPNHFSNIDPACLAPPPVRSKKKYLALFNKVNDEKRIGEASPIYLRDPKSPYLIQEMAPDAKIIIMLRDPLGRAFSQYLSRLSNARTYSFSEAITLAMDSEANDYDGRILNGGMYYEQVKRYFDVFGTSNVKVIIFEEFIKDSRNKVKQVLNFLGIDSEVPSENLELPHNLVTRPKNKFASFLLQNKITRNVGRRVLPQGKGTIVVKKILGKEVPKPKMDEKDRTFLEKYYNEDVISLEKLLGRHLPWPLITKLN